MTGDASRPPGWSLSTDTSAGAAVPDSHPAPHSTSGTTMTTAVPTEGRSACHVTGQPPAANRDQWSRPTDGSLGSTRPGESNKTEQGWGHNLPLVKANRTAGQVPRIPKELSNSQWSLGL